MLILSGVSSTGFTQLGSQIPQGGRLEFGSRCMKPSLCFAVGFTAFFHIKGSWKVLETKSGAGKKKLQYIIK